MHMILLPDYQVCDQRYYCKETRFLMPIYLPKKMHCIHIINRLYKTYSGMSLRYLSHSYNQCYGEEEDNGKEHDIACNSGIAVSYTISRN